MFRKKNRREHAFSVRKINADYTGFCMRVLRTSDNTTLDIGFDVNGDLDVNAITAFVGSSDGRVSIWYHQGSGVSRNATQSAVANMPFIAVGGVVQTFNGKPCILFDRSKWLNLNYMATSIKQTMVVVHRATNLNAQRNIFELSDSDGLRGTRCVISGNGTFSYQRNGYISSIDTGNLNNVHHCFIGIFNLPNLKNYRNGSLQANTINSSLFVVNQNPISFIGRTSINPPTNSYDGVIQELQFFNYERDSEVTLIFNEINNYYGMV